MNPDEEQDPEWSFSFVQNLRCPECGSRLSGLDWVLNTVTQRVCGMSLIPCGDVLDTDVWELSYPSGGQASRQLGHRIRKPGFTRKRKS